MTKSLRIAVAGGGVGGLTAALALRARGMDVTVFEQAAAFREIGAGITLGPNTTGLLRGAGIDLTLIGCAGTGVALRSPSGTPIASSATAENRPTGQFYALHRADFVGMLVNRQPKDKLHFGYRCVKVVQNSDQVQLTFANGEMFEADAFIGADGIRSLAQGEMGLKVKPTSEGIMAYRGLVPSERLPWMLDLSEFQMWIGLRRSFMCFPVSRGQLINISAFVPTDSDSPESWSAPGDLNVLAAEYAGWDDRVQEAIAALDEASKFGIYDRAPLPHWSTGRMTLLGDAAHAMVPHVGQGAGQAIEDAFSLAVLLENSSVADVPARLRMYETLRLGRTSDVQAISREAGRLYHSEMDSPERLQHMSKWRTAVGTIYEHDVVAAAKACLLNNGNRVGS